jgi:hypothetical protein
MPFCLRELGNIWPSGGRPTKQHVAVEGGLPGPLPRIFHDFDVIDQPFGFYRIIGGIVEADWGWSQQVFLRI